MNVLVVDGYNIIGAWKDLKVIKKQDLGQARDELVELMADYQSYLGYRVIIVFDAYYVKGPASKLSRYNVELIYTKENETADECIERIVAGYKNVKNQVYVATSDYMEQRITFGRGALRKSARELLVELKEIAKGIEEDIETQQKMAPQSTIALKKEVLEVFEKWRRGNK